MDENEVPSYGSGAAALFAVAAREGVASGTHVPDVPDAGSEPARAMTKIWAWCPTTGEREEMVFVRDAGIYEVYRCHCGQEHCHAVR